MNKLIEELSKSKNAGLNEARLVANLTYSNGIQINKNLQNEIAQIARDNNFRFISERTVVNYVVAIACITRALDASFKVGEKPTMSEILVQTYGDLPFRGVESFKEIRQIVYMGYRTANGIKSGLEYNPMDFVKGCEPIISENLFTACKLMNSRSELILGKKPEDKEEQQTNLHSMLTLKISSKEKVIGKSILSNKDEIMKTGQEYATLVKHLSHSVDKMCIAPTTITKK